MPGRQQGVHRATRRLAVVLLAVAGLATGCAGTGPAPVPTTAAPSLPSAEELAAAARAEAITSVEAADAQLTLLPGVTDAVVRLGEATAEVPLPVIAVVTFAADLPVDQVRSGATTTMDVLGALGLVLDHVELIVDRASGTDEAEWTGAGVGPNLAREAQLWVDLIELGAGARSTTITHKALDPLHITVFPEMNDGNLPTAAAVYLGLVDACVAAGIDVATTDLDTLLQWQISSWGSTPIPAEVLTAVEQVDILDFVNVGGVVRYKNNTEVSFYPHDGATITPYQQLALLGPFEHFGLLTDDLTVTLTTLENEMITLWPEAPPA